MPLVGFQPKVGLPERLTQRLDADFHDALGNSGVDGIDAVAGDAVVRKLKNVGLQTEIVADDFGDDRESYHGLAQEEFEPEESFRAYASRLIESNERHGFGRTYIGQSGCELQCGPQTTSVIRNP